MLLVPVLMSGPNDPEPGLFRLDTTTNHIVVLFRTRVAAQQFQNLVARRLEPNGEELRWLETPYDRIEDVVDMLAESGTSRRGEDVFIANDHPLYERLADLL